MWIRPDQHAEVRGAWPPVGQPSATSTSFAMKEGKKRSASYEEHHQDQKPKEEQKALLSSDDESSD